MRVSSANQYWNKDSWFQAPEPRHDQVVAEQERIEKKLYGKGIHTKVMIGPGDRFQVWVFGDTKDAAKAKTLFKKHAWVDVKTVKLRPGEDAPWAIRGLEKLLEPGAIEKTRRALEQRLALERLHARVEIGQDKKHLQVLVFTAGDMRKVEQEVLTLVARGRQGSRYTFDDINVFVDYP